VPSLDGEDHDRAVFFGTFIAVSTAAFPVIGLTPTPVELRIPLETVGHSSIEVAHAHDPPQLTSLPPRAPPASPVLI
jgi:hypothetical protein